MRPSWSQIAVFAHFPIYLNPANVVVVSGIFAFCGYVAGSV
jgi:hypothetical protein